MIGTIDIKIHAAKPQMPLPPIFSFRGSPSSLRIMDVPRRIGTWEITAVKVAATYPDNSISVQDAARVGNVWVCTFAGCDVSGKTANGIQILADGIDESGEPVTGYVLGCGDLYILNRDASIAADAEKWYVRYCDEIPENPATGDLIIDNGAVKMYDGDEWITIEPDLSAYATKQELHSALATKQDKLSTAQVSAIDSVVDERKTVVTYNDGTVAQYDIIGKLEGDVNPSTGTPIPTRQIPNVTNVRHIVIGSGVTEIVDMPFKGCNLESIKLPDNGLVLGQQALAACGLHSVIIPESVGAIGYEAFAVNPLAQVLFIGKPIPNIQAMENYPWGITDTSIINTWNAASEEWVEERVEAVAADLRYRIAKAGFDSPGVSLPDGVTVTNGGVQITGDVVWQAGYQCWSLPDTYTTWYEDGGLKEYSGALLGVQYYLNGEPIDTPPNLVGIKRVLADRTVNLITPTGGLASIDIELPAAVTIDGVRRARDFILDVLNVNNSENLKMEFTDLGTDYVFVTEDGESIVDITTFDAGVRARLYFTETAIGLLSPTGSFHVARVTLGDDITSTTTTTQGGN